MISTYRERINISQASSYEFKRIYRLVSERYGSKEKTVLDYGCGTGYGTAILAPAFGKVQGVDTSDDAVAYCKQNYPKIDFKILDPSAQPFPDETFDCIFSFQVFEHVPLEQVNSYLIAIWSMLKPGGTAIITTPKSENYYGGYSGNPFHIKEYKLAELRTVISCALPDASVKYLVAEDVFSTNLASSIRKIGRNNRLVSISARLLAVPFKVLERSNILSTDYRTMLKEIDHNKKTGSYYIELTK